MKEDHLIRALVRDLRPAPPLPRVEQQFAVYLLWTSVIVTAFIWFGPGLSNELSRVAVFACALMFGGTAMAAITSAIPGRRAWTAAAVALAGALLWTTEIATHAGPDPWGGVPWQKCFRFTVVFGVLIAAGALYLVSRAWPLRPRISAALALASGASAAAFTISLECPSAAFAHVLIGHLLPVLVLATVGGLLGSRLFHHVSVRIER